VTYPHSVSTARSTEVCGPRPSWARPTNTRPALEGSPHHNQRAGLTHARRSPSRDAHGAALALDRGRRRPSARLPHANGEAMARHKGKGPHQERLDGRGVDGVDDRLRRRSDTRGSVATCAGRRRRGERRHKGVGVTVEESEARQPGLEESRHGGGQGVAALTRGTAAEKSGCGGAWLWPGSSTCTRGEAA
jgi:hypothetical protein